MNEDELRTEMQRRVGSARQAGATSITVTTHEADVIIDALSSGPSGCPVGGPRCPESICDCFVDTYPDDPAGLHPEAFTLNTGEASRPGIGPAA